MAKVVITLEDKIDGNVKITAEPNFETIAKRIHFGVEPTAAEAYALFALRQIREESKKQGKLQLKLPKLS